MRVFITGFDPFGRFKTNPSEQAVELLPRSVKINEESVKLSRGILPTCCSGGWEKLKAMVKPEPGEPYAVILCGMASTRAKITVERFALNTRHYFKPDNGDHAWDDEYIDPHGPDAIRTKVPLHPLVEWLIERGIAADISSFAGVYVCNETYYKALSTWQNDKNCMGVLFVHVPLFASYTKEVKKLVPGRRAKAGPQDFADALVETVKFLATYDQGNTPADGGGRPRKTVVTAPWS